jgi:hypothetical protein
MMAVLQSAARKKSEFMQSAADIGKEIKATTDRLTKLSECASPSTRHATRRYLRLNTTRLSTRCVAQWLGAGLYLTTLPTRSINSLILSKSESLISVLK